MPACCSSVASNARWPSACFSAHLETSGDTHRPATCCCCCTCRQVPATLNRNVINNVRDAAISILAQRPKLNAIRNDYAMISSTNSGSGFLHPVGLVGPAELAALRYRMANRVDFNSPQPGASDVLLSGQGVPPKTYPGGWAPPINTPVDGYPGPLAMTKVEVKYGGNEANAANCPANYPAGTPAAPKGICGHVSFVEMDGQVGRVAALQPASQTVSNPVCARSAQELSGCRF